MWTISQVVCMGMLAVLSAVDICVRRIPVWSLALASASALCYQLYQIHGGKGDFVLMAGGIGIGILFLLISRVTGEGMGYGDSLAVLSMGIYLGIWELIEVLAAALFLLAAASMICMTIKKMSRKVRIPFFPFLAAGYLVCLVC